MSFSEIMQSKIENGPKMDLLGPDCLNDKRPLKGPKELYDIFSYNAENPSYNTINISNSQLPS